MRIELLMSCTKKYDYRRKPFPNKLPFVKVHHPYAEKDLGSTQNNPLCPQPFPRHAICAGHCIRM